jgi:hypothetical protein
MGQENKANLEQQRIGRTRLIFDFVGINPINFGSFWFAGMLLIWIAILKNDVRYRYEFFIVLFLWGVIDAIVTVDLFHLGLQAELKTMIRIVGILGYIGTIAVLRRLRTPSSLSRWHTILHVMTSSYFVLLRGMLPAYYLGHQLSGSQLGGKVAEILFLVVFFGLHRWIRRGSNPAPALRHLKFLVLGLAVLFCWGAWAQYWMTSTMITINFPLPWIDRGHPNWVAYMDRKVDQAIFRKRDVLFLQSLVHQLNGDREFAKQAYAKILKDARALNNLGVIMSDENPDDARLYFEQALQRDPDCVPARYNLGVMTRDRKRIEQAQALDRWKADVYQKYAPNKLWIVIPPIMEWTKTLYWSRGGFLVNKSLIGLGQPEDYVQTEIQHLSYE